MVVGGGIEEMPDNLFHAPFAGGRTPTYVRVRQLTKLRGRLRYRLLPIREDGVNVRGGAGRAHEA